MDNVRRFVLAVMREILSVTPRLMVLMRLDLFFTGVPNLRRAIYTIMSDTL